MTVGAAKFGLMAAAGSGAAGFTAFGGLVSQWMGAASVITDSSAASNNGTTTGVRYSTAATKSGTYGLHSVDFGDPPRGYVRAPTMSTLGMTTAFTVSCWAKALSAPATWTALFGQASTSSWGDGFGLYYSGNDNITGFVNGYSSNTVIASSITTTNWNHYVLTYDGSNLKIYINGSLVDTTANSGTVASNAIGIADLNIPNYSYTWPGVSDEYGFWNEALTASEITAIYNSGTPLSLSADSGNYASSANLKAYYKFEDPSTYRVHTFRGSGKFLVSAGEADVDWLVVAGGGGGNNGGGGAGGMRTGTAFAASKTSGDSSSAVHTITVGAGGRPGGTGNVTYDNRGYDSSALGFTSSRGGGGGGGAGSPGSASDGGSGGGEGPTVVTSGGIGEGNDGGYSPVEGYDGGTGNVSAGAGGGGGASAVGVNATTNNGGAGGAGATGYGIGATTPYYAGGGGGSGTNGALGGVGGGGSGITSATASGVPNTGGGGGGIYTYGTEYGGAGIVIIRYEVAA